MNDEIFSVKVAAGFTQAGGNDFPLIRARDVDVSGESLINYLPVILTQDEYNTIVGGGTIILPNGKTASFEENRIYMIKKEL